jgi:Spy/CpxP family protein refolding chaperone
MKLSALLASLSMATILTTSVFAADEAVKKPCDSKPACDMKTHKGGFTGKNMHQMMFDKMVKTLDLTKEQKDQLASLKSGMKEQMKTNFQNRPNVGSYIKDGAFDKAAFTADASQRNAKMIESRAEFLAKFVALLTPEQQTKLANYKPKEHGCKK